MPKKHEILEVITAIRESHPDMSELYTKGQCYNFYKILRSIYGQSVEPWYDYLEGHVYSKIGGRFYDIRGVRKRYSTSLVKLDHKHGHRPHRWGKGDNRRLQNKWTCLE